MRLLIGGGAWEKEEWSWWDCATIEKTGTVRWDIWRAAVAQASWYLVHFLDKAGRLQARLP